MRSRAAILIGACVAVLVGAWLASRALLSEDPVTAPPLGEGAPQRLVRPMEPVPPPALAQVPTPRTGTTSPEPVVPRPLPLSQPPPTSVPLAGTPTSNEFLDEPESPYLGDSRELEYAELLLLERDAGPRLKSARDVFARCLELHPENQRCAEGLAKAEAQLDPSDKLLRPKAVEVDLTQKATPEAVRQFKRLQNTQ